MRDGIPRLRMFAGPNGSGKSTLKTFLRRELQGVYLNPDEIERDIRINGNLHLAAYDVTAQEEEFSTFLRHSSLLVKAGMSQFANEVSISNGYLRFTAAMANSYVASVVADFLRQKLLNERKTFTLETVMSHPGKVELLQKAQDTGYRTYLYYIATEDPDINVSRVKSRVHQGGHPVPEDRIIKRYQASLDLLPKATRHTNRAYIFDNSGEGQEKTWLAEVTEGRDVEMKTDRMPAWFKRTVWDKLGSSAP